jgi:YVTN family beta-propeller protein
MSRTNRDRSRTGRKARTERLRPLAALLAAGLTAPAFAGPSTEYPTYRAGPLGQHDWVLGNGQIVTPAGKQVTLGPRVRAKAVALNPDPKSHTAAILTMGASQAVEVFDTRTGVVLQNYNPSNGDSSGSYSGIAYSADGKSLLFSQDTSYIAIAKVLPTGLFDAGSVSVPPNNSFITCFPSSPIGDYGVPCGTFYTPSTSYPGGLAFASDGKSAYALLNQNNTLAQINLSSMKQGTQVRVGNAPHSVLLLNDNIAYVSNEGGVAATKNDFQILSAGTPIVADTVNGSSTTGSVSVVDLASMKVKQTISNKIGLHPTGMAMFGPWLLVANTYSDTISVIDTRTNMVARTIDLTLPITVPGQSKPNFMLGPNAIAVDPAHAVAYVALYNGNAIAVVDLSGGAMNPVMGFIPVAYAPSSVVLDAVNNQLIVANDKGIGTRLSFETDYGVTGYNSHQDSGTVSIVPVPNPTTLATYTTQVYQNNHWDLKANIDSAGGGKPSTPPVAMPAKIGDPSLIKHVFMIIRENRTYDQILGDVKAGDGDASLAVFGPYTPNAHNWITRFPLMDNFYTPSRQSADGHQWIVEATAPYADDIQSPDWVRSYPGGNAGDSLAYQKKGFLFQEAADAGLSLKIYGEYVENDYWWPSGEPSWCQFYADSQSFQHGTEKALMYQSALIAESSIPVVENHLVKNFPQFDLNIPDQWRVDVWSQDFENDVKAGTVPSLTIMWIMDDHTGGPPTPQAEQGDNDLAVGRIIDKISHSKVWDSSAIFIEEDDSQNGVDHVDGHRSPGYVVSPYVLQYGPTNHTYYTQFNMTRAIEQILGLPPMNQFDLVATPMRDIFTNTPNTAPWTHVPPTIDLTTGANCGTPSAAPLASANPEAAHAQAAWTAWKQTTFAGFASHTPDVVDEDVLNHFDWYAATNYTKPYPGETYVRLPTEFRNALSRSQQGPSGGPSPDAARAAADD